MNLTQAYKYCAKLTRQAGSSFYYGMRLLPYPKRSAMYAIYAWSRICDDAVDEYEGSEALTHLQEAEQMVFDAFGDAYETHHHPVVQALGDAVREYHMPIDPFLGLLRGMKMDIQSDVQLQTSHDLEQYCDDVAGTIGNLCVHIFGYRDEIAFTWARDMGRALQLTNILRDLDEDVKRGRVYLPQEEMGRHGYSVDDLLTHRATPQFYTLMDEQIHRARGYFEGARNLFPLIDGDSLRCLRVIYSMYFELLEKIQRHPFHVFDKRIRLSGSKKLRLVWGALWNASAIG